MTLKYIPKHNWVTHPSFLKWWYSVSFFKISLSPYIYIHVYVNKPCPKDIKNGDNSLRVYRHLVSFNFQKEYLTLQGDWSQQIEGMTSKWVCFRTATALYKIMSFFKTQYIQLTDFSASNVFIGINQYEIYRSSQPTFDLLHLAQSSTLS